MHGKTKQEANRFIFSNKLFILTCIKEDTSSSPKTTTPDVDSDFVTANVTDKKEKGVDDVPAPAKNKSLVKKPATPSALTAEEKGQIFTSASV